MARCARLLFLTIFLCTLVRAARADARFDLVGPRIDVRVTRGADTLPIASVPNLQPGDKLWLHPDLPPTQSVKYLLICVFLRGNTNPPPDEWFIRVETWQKKVREEGVFVTVPPEAQQAVLLMAPETGGDFSTLKSAVRGRPGVFVRAAQDLNEAGFEQARIEKYLASIRRVPPSDPPELQKHSDLLARTLALRPNGECFKRPVDMQFTCLTQSGSQTLLDDGHGQTIVSRLSTGQNSDFIQAASYTKLAGGGAYSAYVGAVVDLVRIMSNLHTAQYQYIPAIAFPQGEAMNLRLNTPPSFHNPKSVLVVGLPAVQTSVPPPLRPADAGHVACLLEPSVTLPIEGAPLVFSTDLAHDLVLHLNAPEGSPAEQDIPLTPDAYQGGLMLRELPEHRRPLRENIAVPKALTHPELSPEEAKQEKGKPEAAKDDPVILTGTIKGRWGFDEFTGPTLPLQRLPGTGWHIVGAQDNSGLIAGKSGELRLSATGTACVHTITAKPTGSNSSFKIPFKPAGHTGEATELALSLPLEHTHTPGDLHLEIQQFGQPKSDEVATRTFSEPAKVESIELHAGDKNLVVAGTDLGQIAKLTLGDLVFTPQAAPADADAGQHMLRMAMAPDAKAPPTHVDDKLTARVELRDGRELTAPVRVSSARPVISLLRKSIEPDAGATIALSNTDDVPLNARLTFTLKSPAAFPRNGRIEVETVDGTLRTVLTLAPSGGLLLQDPHTIVATLDPLRSFGPSAFGALRVRVVYPGTTKSGAEPERKSANKPEVEAEAPASDWLPLVTLVRLPVLTHLQCPADPAQACTLTGDRLFLLQALSADPAFENPVAVPDGYTGTSLTVPHPAAAGTLFVHLRDDPASLGTATPPVAPPAPAATARNNRAGSKS